MKTDGTRALEVIHFICEESESQARICPRTFQLVHGNGNLKTLQKPEKPVQHLLCDSLFLQLCYESKSWTARPSIERPLRLTSHAYIPFCSIPLSSRILSYIHPSPPSLDPVVLLSSSPSFSTLFFNLLLFFHWNLVLPEDTKSCFFLYNL